MAAYCLRQSRVSGWSHPSAAVRFRSPIPALFVVDVTQRGEGAGEILVFPFWSQPSSGSRGGGVLTGCLDVAAISICGLAGGHVSVPDCHLGADERGQ